MIQIDMDMPKSCWHCKVEELTHDCLLNLGYADSIDYKNERHPDCPLHEVKIGKWIRRHCISKNNKSIDMFVCSSCGEEFSWDAETGIKIDNYNICPNCGSYNRGVKSDDE